MPADTQSTPAATALRAAYGDDAFGDLTDSQIEEVVRTRVRRGLPPFPWNHETWRDIDAVVSRLKSERAARSTPQPASDQRQSIQPTFPHRASRWGVATSVIKPELDDLRQYIADTINLKPGQPVIARSRTGALYPSELGTPETTIKGAALGATTAAMDYAEGATTPVSLALGALGTQAGRALTGGALDVAGKVSGTAGRGLVNVGSRIERPANLVSLIELLHNPRSALAAFAAPYMARTGGDVLQRSGRVLRYLGDTVREIDNPVIPTEGQYLPSPNAPGLRVFTRVPITIPED